MTHGLEQNYQNSGFGHTLGFGRRPALLMIDFVMAYLDPDSPLYAGVEVVKERCVDLLALCRSAALPIFHTHVSYRPGSPDGGAFRRKLPLLKVFELGSHLAEFVPGLEPGKGESVITKQYASAFFGTPLAASLTMLGVDSVLLAGVTTSGCVRASAVDALQYGFASIVVKDAVGDRHPEPHKANLFDLQAKYSDLVTVAQVGQYLSERQ